MNTAMQLTAEDGIGWLRFTEPDRRNPYSLQFVEDLCALLQEASARDDIRAVVMTGGPQFSSGGDLKSFREVVGNGLRATQELLDAANRGPRAAYEFPKPLIAAVNGVCYGGGMSIALCADFIVCAEDARFCQVFARIGGCPDTGSSWLLQKRVGAATARLLTFTAREIDGATAAKMGIADKVVASNQTEREAGALAAEIAAHPQFAFTMTKRVMRAAATATFDETLEIEGHAQTILLSANDFPEAMNAFAEKRKPVFTDK